MNEWDLTKEDWRDSRPLGRKIQNFIEENPQYVIYLRKDPRFPCSRHYNQATETPTFSDYSCTECWGFGVKMSGIIVPSRISMGANADISPKDGYIRGGPGYLTDYTVAVHFPRAVCPKQKDLILVCEWNKPSQKIIQAPYGRPIRIASIYMIQQIQDHFMRELAWFSCGVKSLDIIADHVDSLLIPRLSNLDVLDVETTWKQDSYW